MIDGRTRLPVAASAAWTTSWAVRTSTTDVQPETAKNWSTYFHFSLRCWRITKFQKMLIILVPLTSRAWQLANVIDLTWHWPIVAHLLPDWAKQRLRAGGYQRPQPRQSSWGTKRRLKTPSLASFVRPDWMTQRPEIFLFRSSLICKWRLKLNLVGKQMYFSCILYGFSKFQDR